MNPHLILASSSASRKMILDKLGLPYYAISPDIEESVLPGEEASSHVSRLAREKALKVATQLPNYFPQKPTNEASALKLSAQAEEPASLIIGCDSVCLLNDSIMSKPETHEAAVQQLQAASGKTVYFYSGLALYHTQTQHLQTEVVRTEVHFKTLSPALIEAYLQKDQPYHCAGSIQAEGLGILLIEKMIADDPNSLIGLPLIALIKMLEKENFHFF